MAQKKKQEDAPLESVQEALTKSEMFIEKYRNHLIYSVLGVIVVVLGTILFFTHYLNPLEAEGQEKLVKAVRAFENESYELALVGDDEIDGFEQIADEYSLVDAGEVAAYYAGVCAYQLERYEDAIAYLAKYDNGSLNLAPAARMLEGDAYTNLGEYKKAAKCFKKAAKSGSEFIAPKALKKAGLVYEELGEYDEAVEVYTEIKEKYFATPEAADIEKYIAQAEAKAK